MTFFITPEQAERILATHPPYATLGSLSHGLTPAVKNRFPDHTPAMDVLDMPLDKATTFPHWLIVYLHRYKETVFEESDILVEAIQQGYRKYDIRAVKQFLSDTQSNIGVWYDSQKKKTYYCYYEPDALTIHTQECLDRGDDW
jgi:hypothetical protein